MLESVRLMSYWKIPKCQGTRFTRRIRAVDSYMTTSTTNDVKNLEWSEPCDFERLTGSIRFVKLSRQTNGKLSDLGPPWNQTDKKLRKTRCSAHVANFMNFTHGEVTANSWSAHNSIQQETLLIPIPFIIQWTQKCQSITTIATLWLPDANLENSKERPLTPCILTSTETRSGSALVMAEVAIIELHDDTLEIFILPNWHTTQAPILLRSSRYSLS